jgi:diphosphomevalonate decarboxylase
MTMRATALAHPNIAFIKYWGIRDLDLRLPANDSLSMTIGPLATRTTVEFDQGLSQDALILNSHPVSGPALTRMQGFMDRMRQQAGKTIYARVTSDNNFPISAGLASSASAYAALALAGTSALGLKLSEPELSSLARFGSGSASRSIPGGFVSWQTDPQAQSSFAESFAPPDHWRLCDCIAMISTSHKAVSSQEGMKNAPSSPLQAARIADTPRRLHICKRAILNRDFEALAKVIEQDSNMMHAVMMTAEPPLFYWHPQSIALMKAVRVWQAEGLPVTYTLDAGPNVHVICPQVGADKIIQRLRQFPGVLDVIQAFPAGPARLIQDDSQVYSPQV